jgi:peroxiredoxin
MKMLVLAAGILVVVGCTTGDASVSQLASMAESADGGDDQGTIAPEFTLPMLNGENLSLADTHGQVRLIDFWATWCAPCREEVPMLNELQASYADRGFRIIAISDEDADAIRDFVSDNEVAYTNLVGTEEIMEAYGVLGLPAAYLLDAEGRVIESFIGPKPRRVLEEKIEALLATSPSI